MRPAVTHLVLAALVATSPAAAIVGGQNADPGEYPWQAAITNGSGSSQYCGGSLVAPEWVLTAAHCLEGLLGIPLIDQYIDLILFGDVYVLLGTNDLRSGGESIRATDLYIHPQYDGDHDVGLIHLQRASTQGTPVPLAHAGDAAKFAPGVLATVTGWGATSEGGGGSNTLREVQVPIVSDASCRQAYPSLDGATEICAGYPQGGKDSCQGDSGGPLVVPDGSGWLLAGVVSWGNGCARAGYPGVYADVAGLADWIEDTMQPAPEEPDEPLPVPVRVERFVNLVERNLDDASVATAMAPRPATDAPVADVLSRL